jgi:hypothetical protein
MADIAPKLIHLSAEELQALHNNVHKSEATPASIEVHHTVLNEMARRKMERPQDAWDNYEILIDTLENVDLTTLGGLPAETILDVIKETGSTTGNLETFLTIDGYQMRIESVEKRITKEGDKYTVYNEAGTRSFGTYDSREEAEERLRQIEFFKAEESYKPPKSVREAAQRAIEWIDGGLAGSGFTSVGRTRAGQLARGENISIDTLKRMKSFLARHKVDGQALGFNRGEKGFPSAGRVSWDAWGGDAGFAWAESMVERYENAMEKHGDHDQAEHGSWATGGSGGEDKGSSSRTAMAPDKKASAERSPDAVKQAERIRRDAEAVEPVVTSLMEGIAKSIDADFAELNGKSSLVNRLKSTDSLARKIDQDAEKDHGGDREKAANALSDAVRYTLNVDENNYTDGVEKTVKAVEETGWKVESVKNFWQAGDPYDGTNIKLSKNGVKVELQLHTPTSHKIKEVDLHDTYEKYRVEKDNSKRQNLWDSMVDKARAIPRPANMGKLLTLGTLVTQTFETAQQAGLVKSTGVDIMWRITRGGTAVCDILQN